VIHSTAIIDPRAEIHPDCVIGPYVVVDGPVKIGRATRVMAHATIAGWTEIGAENEIHPGAALGGPPQDKAYSGAETYLKIGDRNVFRENVQVHRGTAAGSSTIIGNENYLMACAHVGHNCWLGDRIVLANNALLGGYVDVGDGAFISGNCVVHQFVRVGELSLMRGLSGASRDVPPYAIVDWQHTVRSVNVVGLKRAGFEDKKIRALKEAFRILFRKGKNLKRALAEVEADAELAQEVRPLLEFIKASKRGVCVGA
jgi:UDP-N-acetylglucosamine acyltransferase